MSTGRDELFGSFISIKSPLEVLREFLISKRPFGYETFVSENFRSHIYPLRFGIERFIELLVS